MLHSKKAMLARGGWLVLSHVLAFVGGAYSAVFFLLAMTNGPLK